MEENFIAGRQIGVNIDANGIAKIVLWAPKLEQLAILIPAKNLSLPMQPKKYGFWTLETDLLRTGDEYLFLLNNTDTLPDPCALSQPKGVHGPSEVFDLRSHLWSDENWEIPDLSDFIIYELHTGTFSETGTFEGIESKLDYLVGLGVTAIEIMPVAQFPGERNWGYDGVFPFCVQNSYGGAHGLMQLVDKCHQKGLAVILDVVFNHLGPEGNYLDHFGHYFTDNYHTPWGNAINFDDAWCDPVRSFYIENALMWFRDFHIDALRLDAVHAIKDGNPVHILQEIKQQVDKLSRKTSRNYYLIVELDLNDTRYINPVEHGGFGMDAQWIDEFHHALRVSSGQERSGYYADFDGINSLAKAYKDAYVYDGAYSEHRKKKFGMKGSGNPGKQFVVFSQNHDHVGNRMLGERTSLLVSFEMQKLLAGAVLASPYLPLLFMGEEYGEKNPFQYFVSHTDPELAESVRNGRKREFQAFHLEGEPSDPMAVETFRASKLNWDQIGEMPNRVMLSFYKKMIQVRKSLSALRVLNRDDVSVTCLPDQQILILHRRHGDQEVISMMNFSDKPESITSSLSDNIWHKVIASSDQQWNGKDDLPEFISGALSLLLPPSSITIYTNQYEESSLDLSPSVQ